MKMKRYFAPDSRQALKALRDEQGPDAVILSNKRINGGVEIIAAMDYDDAIVSTSLGNPKDLSDIDPYQNDLKKNKSAVNNINTGASSAVAAHAAKSKVTSLDVNTKKPINTKSEIKSKSTVVDKHDLDHQGKSGSAALNKIKDELASLRNIMEAPLMQFSWGETRRVQPLYANLLKQLMGLGISSNLCQGIAKDLDKKGLTKRSWLESLNCLSDMVPISEEDILTSGGIVSLMGPTGVGKTTTIAKLAARFALKHGRRGVTLITTDNYRIGAHEQLRSYGRILGIPVHVAADAEELKVLLDDVKRNETEKTLTLIDTAGICQKDERLNELMNTINIPGADIKNYLVLSATGQMNLQDDVINSFGKANLDGCVITKIDEAASLGEIISVLIQHNLPAVFVCDGQKVPDDLHRARGKLLVKEAVILMRNLNKPVSNEELAYTFGGMVNNGNV